MDAPLIKFHREKNKCFSISTRKLSKIATAILKCQQSQMHMHANELAIYGGHACLQGQ